MWADHAGNIADAAIELNNEPQLAEYVDLPRMAARASDMLGKAIEAFTREDSQLARHIIELDKEIDSIYRKVVRELMDYMRTEPATSRRILHLLFVAKHIERIGDYIKDVCELTVYMAEAQFTHGMHITFVFSNSTDDKSRFVLQELGMPFSKPEDMRGPGRR